MDRKLPYLALSLVVLALYCFAQTGKIENLGPLTDAAVPESIRNVLEPKGYRVLLDDGTPVCQIWPRKGLPSQPRKEVSGALYPQLVESTLLGVISFPQTATDYRGQGIKPGFYTLRYELLPNDGNHLGVAPNRDFLLLIPAGADSEPAAVLKFDELVNLSRKTTGTHHPAPLLLAQPEGGSAPAVSKDEEEHWIFSAGIKLASGEEMPFALVVKGVAVGQ